MEHKPQNHRDPVPVRRAARMLSVPADWLREECIAGRLPALIAGDAVLVDVDAVAAILARRARGEEVGE